MTRKANRARRYAFRGKLIVGRIGGDLVATGRPAPKGTAPLPRDLRAQVGKAMDEAEADMARAAYQQILDRRGNALEPSSRTRAIGALQRMAQGAQQEHHNPDRKDHT